MAARRHFFVIFMFDRANARQPSAISDFSGWHCGLKSNTHIRRHAATAN